MGDDEGTGPVRRLPAAAAELLPAGPVVEVALLTRDRELAELVSPAVAACGMRLHLVASSADPVWARAAAVLLDSRVLLGSRLGPGADVIAADARAVLVLDAEERVGSRADADEVWRAALGSGADDVLRLPLDAPRLLHRLQTLQDPDRGGCVIGVIGGRGGAGASVLAAEVAAAAAGDGSDVLLCDTDPLGGGADLLLPELPTSGLHWDDLTVLPGPLRGGALRAAVPRGRGGPGVLTWQPGAAGELPTEVLLAVLDAGRGGHDLVVVDLPRRGDGEAAAVLGRLDVLLLLVPAEVRAVAAAGAVLDRVRPRVADLRLVVRQAGPGGLPARAVADALGVPVSARWPAPRGLPAALDRGDPPGRGGRRRLARAARSLAAGLPPPAARAEPGHAPARARGRGRGVTA